MGLKRINMLVFVLLLLNSLIFFSMYYIEHYYLFILIICSVVMCCFVYFINKIIQCYLAFVLVCFIELQLVYLKYWSFFILFFFIFYCFCYFFIMDYYHLRVLYSEALFRRMRYFITLFFILLLTLVQEVLLSSLLYLYLEMFSLNVNLFSVFSHKFLSLGITAFLCNIVSFVIFYVFFEKKKKKKSQRGYIISFQKKSQILLLFKKKENMLRCIDVICSVFQIRSYSIFGPRPFLTFYYVYFPKIKLKKNRNKNISRVLIASNKHKILGSYLFLALNFNLLYFDGLVFDQYNIYVNNNITYFFINLRFFFIVLTRLLYAYLLYFFFKKKISFENKEINNVWYLVFCFVNIMIALFYYSCKNSNIKKILFIFIYGYFVWVILVICCLYLVNYFISVYVFWMSALKKFLNLDQFKIYITYAEFNKNNPIKFVNTLFFTLILYCYYNLNIIFAKYIIIIYIFYRLFLFFLFYGLEILFNFSSKHSDVNYKLFHTYICLIFRKPWFFITRITFIQILSLLLFAYNPSFVFLKFFLRDIFEFLFFRFKKKIKWVNFANKHFILSITRKLFIFVLIYRKYMYKCYFKITKFILKK